jgi:hypothetical protein
MNRIWLLGILVCTVLAFYSCKPKQSTYRAAYEQAQQRDTETDDYSNEFGDENVDPVNKPRSDGNLAEDSGNTGDDYNDNYAPITEDLYAYDYGDNAPAVQNSNVQISFNLKRYNLVIGTFRNGTNANALKERMQREGYTVDLARNDGGMIRVIVKTTDDQKEILRERNAFRSKHYPNFQDAWVLKRY